MRILVVGAGAIGGYFGGRLADAGRDVTFLVRPRRAAALARTGLVINSPFGNVHLPEPATISADALRQPFDLILLGCKAYDLEGAMDSFAPAVGESTAILPTLNGMRHLDALEQRFGAGHVLGGQCLISTTLDADGRIIHLNENHVLSFGERDGSRSARAEVIARTLSDAGFDLRLSDAILQEMWEKWVFIATAAGITCLMRASIGDIAAAGGAGLATKLLDECAGVAARSGFPLGEAAMHRNRAMVTGPDSGLIASMARDIERGGRTEGDHVLGDLLRRAGADMDDGSLLGIACAYVRTYELRRERDGASPAAAPA